MRYYLIIATGMLLSNCCGKKPVAKPIGVVAASPIDTSFVRNDRIQFDFGRALCDTCVPQMSMDYHVSITIDSANEKLNALSDAFLLRKLSDTTTDWAANLILYSKYHKDAIPLMHSDRETWIRIHKEEDVAYWKQKLGTPY